MSLLQQTEIYWVSILLLFKIYSKRAIEEKHTFFRHAHLSIQSNRIDYEFTSIGCIIALQWLSWTVIFNLFMVHVILMAFLLNGNSNVSNVRWWRWMLKTKPTDILSVTNVKTVKGIILFEFHSNSFCLLYFFGLPNISSLWIWVIMNELSFSLFASFDVLTKLLKYCK